MSAKNLLRLNFSAFDKAWFLNYAYTQLREGWSVTDWKKDIYYFLIDWFSHSDTMKAVTSGSTGIPKNISLKKEFVINSASVTNDFFNLKKGAVALLCLPVKYIAGKLMVVRAAERGLNLYCVEPKLTPYFAETEIDFAAMTPAQVASLLETGEGKDLLNRIDKLIIGGDKISVGLYNKLQHLNTKIWHTYGMTETITHIALRKLNGSDRAEAFSPLDGVTLSEAANGCLVIDAPHIGVHNMITNDMARVYPDGSFVIKGRKDNVVISGGVKLFPEIIEKKIESLCRKPFYLTGVEDDKLGQKLVMVIESTDETDTEMLLDKIKKVVDKYEVPKRIVTVERFVRTESGKIKRAVFS